MQSFRITANGFGFPDRKAWTSSAVCWAKSVAASSSSSPWLTSQKKDRSPVSGSMWETERTKISLSS